MFHTIKWQVILKLQRFTEVACAAKPTRVMDVTAPVQIFITIDMSLLFLPLLTMSIYRFEGTVPLVSLDLALYRAQ